MSTQAVPFTTSGAIEAAGNEDVVWGFAYTGFSSVTVHDGVDATGPVILAGGAAPYSFQVNWPIRCYHGIYVEVGGTGKGTLQL